MMKAKWGDLGFIVGRGILENPELIRTTWRHRIYRQALLQRYLSLRGC